MTESKSTKRSQREQLNNIPGHYPALFTTESNETTFFFPDFPTISGRAKDDFEAAAKARNLLQKTIKERLAIFEQLPTPTNRDELEIGVNSRLYFVPMPHKQGAEQGPIPEYLLRRSRYPKRETWQPVRTAKGVMMIDTEAPQHIKDWAAGD
jgi:hypothetical protein